MSFDAAKIRARLESWMIPGLIFLGLILYANALPNGLFWDDDDLILKNAYIQDWRYFGRYFSENAIGGIGVVSNYWRPILLAVFSICWHLWHGWAAGYHLVSAAFHVANACLLFVFLNRLFRRRWLAWLTALIFLAHPLQTEAVTYAAGLADPLHVFWMLLGLIAFLKWREAERGPQWRGRYLAALGLFALALMTKEIAIILPALVALTDAYRLERDRRERRFKEKLAAVWRGVWPFLALAGFYVLLRATALNFQNTFNLYDEANAFTTSLWVRVLTFCRVLTAYFGLLFWPHDLHMERSVELATSLGSPDVVLGAALGLGLLAAACWLWRRSPIASFGILWFFLCLAPTSNIAVPVSGLLYEHWLYLPLAGFFLTLIWLGLELGRRFRIVAIGLAVAFAVFVIFLGVSTVSRNRVWHDPIIFYNDVLRYSPMSYRVLNNLGNAYSAAGRYAEAKSVYERAIAVDSGNSVSFYNLANAQRDLGENFAAFDNYRRALELQPENWMYYAAPVQLRLRLGDRAGARKTLEFILEGAHDKQPLIKWLVSLALEDEDYDAAVRYLEAARGWYPNDPTIPAAIDQIRQLKPSTP